MNHSESVESNSPGSPSRPPLRVLFKDAVSYWETRRIGYNVALILVVLAWVLFTWPHFRPALTLHSALLLLVLAALANACYCAAYPVDMLIQSSPRRSVWLRRRWILWSFGVLLATLMACYWIADEIYPYIG
jgi:hypothetical protein